MKAAGEREGKDAQVAPGPWDRTRSRRECCCAEHMHASAINDSTHPLVSHVDAPAHCTQGGKVHRAVVDTCFCSSTTSFLSSGEWANNLPCITCAMRKGADEESDWARRYKKPDNPPRPLLLSSHLQTRLDSTRLRPLPSSSISSREDLLLLLLHLPVLPSSDHSLLDTSPRLIGRALNRPFGSLRRVSAPSLPFFPSSRAVESPIPSIQSLPSSRLPFLFVSLPLQENRSRPETPIINNCKLIACFHSPSSHLALAFPSAFCHMLASPPADHLFFK